MSLRMVKPGSVIERTYYAVPTDYSSGPEFEDFVKARDAAIERYWSVFDQTLASYENTVVAGVRDGVPITKEDIAHETAVVKAVVDLRWKIRHPDGGSLDAVIERVNVAHMAKRKVGT